MLIERYINRELIRSNSEGDAKVTSYASLKKLAQLQHVLFFTSSMFWNGDPRVSQFFAVQDQTYATKQKALQVAGSLAAKGHTKLFRSVYRLAVESSVQLREMEPDYLGTMGILGKLERTWYVLGDEKTMDDQDIELGLTSHTLMQQLEASGKKLIFLAQKQPKRLLAIFASGAELNPAYAVTLREMRALGVESSIVSREKERVLHTIAEGIGLGNAYHVEAEHEKQDKIAELTKNIPALGVICTRHDSSMLPPGAFPIFLHAKAEGEGVFLEDLAELPAEIVRARMILQKASKRFFWCKL
jgi:cation transport ATPase